MRHFAVVCFFAIASIAGATTRTVDGTDADFAAKLSLSSAGDTIQYPAGTFSSAGITITKAITVIGAGEGVTTLNLSGSINIYAAARVSGFTLSCGSGVGAIVRNSGVSDSGAVMDHCTINGGGANAITWAGGGLISYVTLAGSNIGEGIWTTAVGGVSAHSNMDSVWAVPSTMGSSDPDILTVENCMGIATAGYWSDFGYGSKVAFRFNTATTALKLDVHGCETTYRSARQLEAYFNRWTSAVSQSNPLMDLRGGEVAAFGNRAEGDGYNAIKIHTYGLENNGMGGATHPDSPLLNTQYWTPLDYPAPDQTGNGPDPRATAGGVAPSYFFNNYTASTFLYNGNPVFIANKWVPSSGDLGGGTLPTNTAGYAVGVTSITFTDMIGNGTGAGYAVAGTAFKLAGDPTYYHFTANGTGWPVITIPFSPSLAVAIPAGASVNASINPLIQYQYQTGNPSATFTAQDMIKADRDIFIEGSVWAAGTPSAFNGSSGVGTGTKAQMLAITGTKVGVGFWVTDEGTWNTENTTVGKPGYGKGQGRLYTWNGSAWAFKYEPYTYPHPLSDPSYVPPVGTAPAAPTSPSATAQSSSAILVSWTDNSSDETGFQIEQSANGSTGWANVASPSAGATSATISGLSASTVYYFRVRAVNSYGNSDWSSVVSATTQAANINARPIAPLRRGINF